MEEDEYIKLKEENEKLKRKLKKIESRLDSIIKINDTTFRNIFDKNLILEKDSYRFNRILQQSDKQGKTILVQKEEQEKILYAQAKMAMMGEMIDNIAHQWKQPLNNLSTVVQTIIFKYKNKTLSDSLMDRFESSSIEQIRYMSNTINDFRDFIKEDKTLKYFKIIKTLKKIELLTKNITLEKRINLKINISDENIELYGVENELIQIFMNLISNSSDAFDKKQKNKVIIIDITTNKKDIIIHFKDNAGGIQKNIINKIFESRFTTKKDMGGTGVGLYMSKAMLEKTLKGQINARNETFKYKSETFTGAVFTIKIPNKLED